MTYAVVRFLISIALVRTANPDTTRLCRRLWPN